jgi:hypothetical protein
VQNGIMNRNEVRAIEKLPRVEGQGMDDYTVQSNLMLAQDLDKIIDAARKGEPRPPAKESPRLNIVKAN